MLGGLFRHWLVYEAVGESFGVETRVCKVEETFQVSRSAIRDPGPPVAAVSVGYGCLVGRGFKSRLCLK